MKRHLLTCVVATTFAALVTGCGNDDPPAAPGPVTRALHFSSASAGGDNRSFWMAIVNNDIITLPIDLYAKFDVGCAPSKLRASLVFDDAAVRVVSQREGPYMQQGGAVTTTSVTTSGNTVTIRIDRPDSLPGAVGQGIFLTLNLQAKPGIAAGVASPLQWTSVNAFTSSFTDCLSVTRNATVTVQ